MTFDEFTDTAYVSQMIVIVRLSKNFTLKEDILTLKPLLNTTRSIYSFNAMKPFLIEKNWHAVKLCCVAIYVLESMNNVMLLRIARCKILNKLLKIKVYEMM